MIHLFHREIEALLEARDRAFAEYAARHPDRDARKGRALETLSEIGIDVPGQKDRVIAALSRRQAPPAPVRPT